MSGKHGAPLQETQGRSLDEHETLPRIAPSPFGIGKIIGRKYRIDRWIAEGGYGVVVAATHVGLGQPVAIKYLKTGPRSNPDVVERFEREGRLAARLTSDHVVRVLDVGEAQGAPYMVMELLKGRDLGKVLEESGPLPIPSAIDYVLQACDGLAQAHALKVVHRDIKPDNLLLAERPAAAPVIKIIDFGISKAPPAHDANLLRQTSQSDWLGSPAYMSPEQLRSSAAVDSRTDIWSMGVTLFELLTGKLPFEGDDLVQLIANILGEQPLKLTALRPEAPAELEALLLKCFEKDPARRFRNIAELAQELAPFGPPRATERSDHIKAVILNAGVSVRPPLRSAGAFHLSVVDMPRATAPEPKPSLREARGKIILGAAALGVVLLLLGILVGARPGANSGSPVARSAATAPAPAVVPPPVTAPPVDVPPATSSPSIAPEGDRTANASTHKPAPAALPAVAPTKASAANASTAPTAKEDPRALFGERQ